MMSSVHRHFEFRAMLDNDMAENATPILDALAETLQQSCQLAVRLEDGFCIALQSTPTTSCFVNMPLGLLYPSSENGNACSAGKASCRPNPALPDVMDICAPVYRGAEQVALLIAPHMKGRGAPSLEQCCHHMQTAALNLSRSFFKNALVA